MPSGRNASRPLRKVCVAHQSTFHGVALNNLEAHHAVAHGFSRIENRSGEHHLGDRIVGCF